VVESSHDGLESARVIFAVGTFFTGYLLTDLVILVALVLSIALTGQSIYTLYLMLYTWDQPEAYARAQAPEQFLPPSISFTVMLPARHEEGVIATTLDRVVSAHYPIELLEVVVICADDDTGTIEEAQRKIDALRAKRPANLRVLTFSDKPINKPHGLNVGFRQTTNEVVTIFDSEDDIHPDIFNIVSTIMRSEPIRVVQCGVQLMNFHSNWYSALNVLEYFFWFKSRLHYHAALGMTPLGGNTVFFSRAVLEQIGGWDEANLTEDADVGIRLSAIQEPIRIVYDDRYVTREETPPTLGHFIKQRTRWSQGFLQTFKKGQWRQLPLQEQRLLAAYTLGFPTAQAVLGGYLLVSIVMMFTFKTPVLTAIVLAFPLYLLAAHLLLAVLGLYEFTSAHQLRPSWKTPLLMILGYLPYQWILSFASVRATLREIRGINNWEKTAHVGAHRAAEAQSDNTNRTVAI
jgi:cellulose synthase/poly-beta-1,6-N-acetylglucosamine synthase-like glycosyltransferase